LGVTPSVWNADYKVEQIGLTSSFYGRVASAQTGIGENFYRDAGGTFRYITSNQVSRLELDSGAFYWYTAGSGTAGNAISFTQAMTLDASGRLGIGTSSPASYARLSVSGTAGDQTAANQQLVISAPTTTAGQGAGIRLNAASGAKEAVSIIGVVNEASGNAGAMTFHVYDLGPIIPERMRIDSAGNLGLGVTPSAWLPLGSGGPILQIQNAAFFGSASTTGVLNNAYYNGGFKYISSDYASWYEQIDSKHVWYTAPSGTAGNAISFTQAMTLDASGRLGIGTSSPNRQIELSTFIAGAPTGSGFVGGALRLSNLTEYESNYGAGGGNPDFLGSIEFYSGDTSAGAGVRTAIKTSVDTYYNANSLCFYTAPSSTAGILERLRIDSSGNVGIGTSSPADSSSFGRALDMQSSGGAAAYFRASSTNPATEYFAVGYSPTAAYLYNRANSPMYFYTNATERMRIDSSGNLLVGTTSGSSKLTVNGAGWLSGGVYPSSTGADNSRIFDSTSGTTGTVTLYIGNAAITTSSDVRLKENIVNTQRNATEIIQQLRVVDHTWNDPSDTSVNNRNSRGVWMGLIAQEAQPIIPWLVNKPLADEDEKGNPQYWHMDYGYAVPLLVKAIQEQQAIIEQLQADVATLKGTA
jgi:hypothetical protein